MVDWLIAIQRWLYGGMADGMRSTVDPSGLPTLMAAAFLFGIVHAFMPGHGKIVLVSYHAGRLADEGVAMGTLLAITHVGTAIVLVGTKRDQPVSRRWRSRAGLRNDERGPDCADRPVLVAVLSGHRSISTQDGKMLAFVTGLVPLPVNDLHPHLCAR
jgi:hypothetical protein